MSSEDPLRIVCLRSWNAGHIGSPTLMTLPAELLDELSLVLLPQSLSLSISSVSGLNTSNERSRWTRGCWNPGAAAADRTRALSTEDFEAANASGALRHVCLLEGEELVVWPAGSLMATSCWPVVAHPPGLLRAAGVTCSVFSNVNDVGNTLTFGDPSELLEELFRVLTTAGSTANPAASASPLTWSGLGM